MKKHLSVCALAALFTTASPTLLPAGTEAYVATSAPSTLETFGTGPYVSVQGGVNLYQDDGDTEHYSVGGGILSARSLSRMGGFAGIKAGYVFGRGVVRPTLEADLFYNGFTTRYRTRFNGNFAGSYKDSTDSAAFMANGILRFALPQFQRFQPYVGAGVGGFTMSETRQRFTNPVDSAVVVRRGKESGLAWQAIAGADFYVNPRWSVYGEYKFLNYVDGSVLSREETLRQHLAGGGIRFHF